MSEKGHPKSSFHFATLKETIKQVALKSNKRASEASDIPVEIVKENQDLVACFLLHNFNKVSLKYADIKPIFKEDDKTDKTYNYSSKRNSFVTEIPIIQMQFNGMDCRADQWTGFYMLGTPFIKELSKIYVQFMQNQMYLYLNQIF